MFSARGRITIGLKGLSNIMFTSLKLQDEACISLSQTLFCNVSPINRYTTRALTPDVLRTFRKNFLADPKNILASNACAKGDPMEICMQRRVVDSTISVFTHKVDELKPMTNQKNSGRCWLYACLNAMRIPFAKHHQIEDFEFSQSYLFFWDKVERCNYFLHNIVSVLQQGEQIDGRLMTFLLRDPIADGGQWDMVVNIIKKYGVVPKKCFADTYSCELSSRLNHILQAKAREYARDLNLLVRKGSSEEKIQEKITVCMDELYRVISICLGIPPETFTWEYYNKSKAYCVVGPITPVKFYEEHVKQHFDVENKVCLVNDPRPENPFGHSYTVDCLGNIIGGRRVVYVNQKIKDLLKYAAESIKGNEAVWFGCDMGKKMALKLGIQDLDVRDYKLMFGIEVDTAISKAERLQYGQTVMTHAMLFTAASLNSNGDPVKFRVENSWGEEHGEKGYITMTADYFEEYVFEIVTDKQFLPKEVLDILKMEPKVLPAWDPMGSLAL